MMKFRNIKDGPITSIVGILIIIASIVSVFLDKASWTESAIGMGIGVSLLTLPDPKSKTGSAAAMALLILVVAAGSCNRKPIVTSDTTKDSSWTEFKKEQITIKGETVTAAINYDSLKAVLKDYLSKGEKPEIVYRNSPESKQSLVFSLDKNGDLQADCTTDDKLVEYLVAENNRLRQTSKTVVIKELPDKFKYIGGGLLALLVLSILVNAVLVYLRR